MTNQVWLIRYSELFLKSDPVRREWEKKIRNAYDDVEKLPVELQIPAQLT